MKLRILVVIAFSMHLITGRVNAESLKAQFDSEKLCIKNKFIESTYLIKNGFLISSSLKNLETGVVVSDKESKPLNPFGLKSEFVKHTIDTITTPETLTKNRCFNVEVKSIFRDYEVKRVFRVYENSPTISSDIYFKYKSGEIKLNKEKGILDDITLPKGHYSYKAIEFYDRTDGNNDLVKENKALGFVYEKGLRGNVLKVKDNMNQSHLFIIKEAPCSYVQLNYPGFDFKVSNKQVKVCGIGLTVADLNKGEWIKGYSSVVGVYDGSEHDFLLALRKHRKTTRRYISDRDDMIMMNTWGDRNKDASIGEEFIKREVDACQKLGITHFQIDDGWQQGLSMNSAHSSGKLWDKWDAASWEPNKERFPNGFKVVADYAHKKGVKLGLWFHPSNHNNYESWKTDAEIVANLHKKYGVVYFKIDGVKLPNKDSEVNLRKFFNHAFELTNNEVTFNLDATADNRFGYFYFNEFGNIFLENRYSDFGKYYPYWTLRNLWMLSKYVRPENLQIEFLNNWRSRDRYPDYDRYAPGKMSFEYCFAVTMAAQPLAWFEGSNIPKKGHSIKKVTKNYRKMQSDFHKGTILPLGDEPNGASWTGFQSINGNKGFFMIYREDNPKSSMKIKTYLKPGQKVKVKHLFGDGKSFKATVNSSGCIEFSISEKNSYGVYGYEVK